MFKPKNLNHEKFEELCALAAIGQISADEFSELKSDIIYYLLNKNPPFQNEFHYELST